jgi:AcrR family transcriptional regulator
VTEAKAPRIDIGSIRREQIVEAAVAVIAEQGIQNLSLSEIESRAGMSRGQLTYYFPTKEAILLAVFDRLLELALQRLGTPQGQACEEASAWDWIRHLLEKLILEPPADPQFGCLQYTFLSQSNHREDFRQRLASLYEHWRSGMAQGLAIDAAANPPSRAAAPRALATIVQALLHGLAMQLAADPKAFDPREVVDLCLDMLGMYVRSPSPGQKKAKVTANKRSAPDGTGAAAAARRPAQPKSVTHE